MAPTRWNPIDRPVTFSNAASVSTASLTSFTMSSDATTLDVSPAARGEVCAPRSKRSRRMTSRMPRRARW